VSFDVREIKLFFLFLCIAALYFAYFSHHSCNCLRAKEAKNDAQKKKNALKISVSAARNATRRSPIMQRNDTTHSN
jgi:hypothetical protein